MWSLSRGAQGERCEVWGAPRGGFRGEGRRSLRAAPAGVCEAPAPEITTWGKGKRCRAPCSRSHGSGNGALPGVLVPPAAGDAPGLGFGSLLLAGFWGSPKRSCSCWNLTMLHHKQGCQASPKRVVMLSARALQRQSRARSLQGCRMCPVAAQGPTNGLKTGGEMAANPPLGALWHRAPQGQAATNSPSPSETAPGQHQAPIRGGT